MSEDVRVLDLSAPTTSTLDIFTSLSLHSSTTPLSTSSLSRISWDIFERIHCLKRENCCEVLEKRYFLLLLIIDIHLNVKTNEKWFLTRCLRCYHSDENSSDSCGRKKSSKYWHNDTQGWTALITTIAAIRSITKLIGVQQVRRSKYLLFIFLSF